MFKLKAKKRPGVAIIQVGLVFLDQKDRRCTLFKISKTYGDGDKEFIDTNGSHWTLNYLKEQLSKGVFKYVEDKPYLRS